MASLTIRPGSQVRLKGQDTHVPDFLVVRCERDRCWIRQQDWGPEAHLTVRFTQLLVPEPEGLSLRLAPASPAQTPSPWLETPGESVPSNVVYLEDYRRRRAP